MEKLSPPAIRLENIGKYFGSVKANADIDMEIHTGRIKALLGENGAGKSTLMSILAGKLRPDTGGIYVDDVPTPILSTHDAHKAGIGMVYQHFMLVNAMTVAENVFLGHADTSWLSPDRMNRIVADLADRYGLGIDPAARIRELSMGERQRVEILKLLYRQSRVLIFDEPTTVLTPDEAEQLFDAFRKMAHMDKAIVFISHKLDEVMAIADEIEILRKGAVVDRMKAVDVSSKAELAMKMVGREVLLQVEKEPVEPKQIILDIQALDADNLHGIDLQLRQGEILAIVGVAGNGQKSLVEIIRGLGKNFSGSVKILGETWDRFHAASTWDSNLIHVPEDRRGLAACLEMNLVDNFLLTTRRGFTNGPWLLNKKAREKTRAMMEQFDVRPLDPDARARQLSGGNLQKLVLAREFYRRPRLIMVEQPTQGLDIGATEEIWRVLLKARQQAGILLITGDLNEALTLADRIAVLFKGKIMDCFPADDEEKVGRIGPLMAGIHAERSDMSFSR